MKTLLLGDVCPTVDTAAHFAAQDIDTLFGDVTELFRHQDFVLVNLECAITEHDGAIKKFGPNLKAPRETASVLKSLGVNCCGLSNNHVFDFGRVGAKDTLQALAEEDIAYTGFGENYEDSRKNYTVEQQGERICVIAVCEHEYSYALEDRMGSRPFDEYDTMEDIRAAKATHDRVIVTYHGGKEHCRYPSPRLRRVCRAMAKNGADVVLCQHSHCIGAYEQFEGCHILYGQGNFHFTRVGARECWNTSLAVEYDTVAHTIGFTPICAHGDRIRLATQRDAATIMAEFSARNRSLQNGEWKAGWHSFCEEMRESYVNVLARACVADSTERENAHFGHYLDCEAHTDVWRELFPTYHQTNERN